MDAPLEVVFEVSGAPVPQPRARVTTRGGIGRAYTPKNHPIHAFRQAVEIQATVYARRLKVLPSDLPHELDVLAVFDRPASHRRRDGTLAAGARPYPPRSDWDNIGKGVSDAITDSASWWIDDDQVVDGRVRKRYAEPGERARTVVTIRRLPR